MSSIKLEIFSLLLVSVDPVWVIEDRMKKVTNIDKSFSYNRNLEVSKNDNFEIYIFAQKVIGA